MASASTPSLWDTTTTLASLSEDDRFLKEQIITYIGNKRSLLHTLGQALNRVRSRLGKEKLRMLDAFAGSGVVSRFFKQHAELLISNDIELYAKVIGDCYLSNRSAIDLNKLRRYHVQVASAADSLPIRNGFIRRLYSPLDDQDIQPGERVFYSSLNAMKIDSLRHQIDAIPESFRRYLLALCYQ